MQYTIKKEVLEFYENGDEEKYFWQRLFPGRKDQGMRMKERNNTLVVSD
jgi:hypothetical protein